MRHRDRNNVIFDILISLEPRRGSPITHLMRKANLNYYQATRYLNLLLKRGYVLKEDGKYRISSLGKEWVKTYLRLKELDKTAFEDGGNAISGVRQ